MNREAKLATRVADREGRSSGAEWKKREGGEIPRQTASQPEGNEQSMVGGYGETESAEGGSPSRGILSKMDVPRRHRLSYLAVPSFVPRARRKLPWRRGDDDVLRRRRAAQRRREGRGKGKRSAGGSGRSASLQTCSEGTTRKTTKWVVGTLEERHKKAVKRMGPERCQAPPTRVPRLHLKVLSVRARGRPAGGGSMTRYTGCFNCGINKGSNRPGVSLQAGEGWAIGALCRAFPFPMISIKPETRTVLRREGRLSQLPDPSSRGLPPPLGPKQPAPAGC